MLIFFIGDLSRRLELIEVVKGLISNVIMVDLCDYYYYIFALVCDPD